MVYFTFTTILTQFNSIKKIPEAEHKLKQFIIKRKTVIEIDNKYMLKFQLKVHYEKPIFEWWLFFIFYWLVIYIVNHSYSSVRSKNSAWWKENLHNFWSENWIWSFIQKWVSNHAAAFYQFISKQSIKKWFICANIWIWFRSI